MLKKKQKVLEGESLRKSMYGVNSRAGARISPRLLEPRVFYDRLHILDVNYRFCMWISDLALVNLFLSMYPFHCFGRESSLHAFVF